MKKKTNNLFGVVVVESTTPGRVGGWFDSFNIVSLWKIIETIIKTTSFWNKYLHEGVGVNDLFLIVGDSINLQPWCMKIYMLDHYFHASWLMCGWFIIGIGASPYTHMVYHRGWPLC